MVLSSLIGATSSVVVTALPLVLILIGFIVILISLLKLRRRPMNEFLRFLWALLIILVPVIGSIVFLIVHPESVDDGTRTKI